MNKSWNKVFEIGVQRTGTSSLGQAFRDLGLRTKGWDSKLYWQCIRGGHDETLSVAKNYDAFEDCPWNYENMYRIFDSAFPDSKFILLQREEDDWIQSYCRAFPGEEDHDFLRQWRRRKYEDIRTYFKDRPKDLLTMNIIDGQEWDTLCPFLELPSPTIPFPYLNKEKAHDDQPVKRRSKFRFWSN